MAAAYATHNSHKIERLVLFASQWTMQSPIQIITVKAYAMMRMDEFRQRRSEDKKAMLPPGWLETFVEASLASDPVGAQMNPPVLRVPNGPGQDFFEYWNAGKPYYDPSKIAVPTLIVGAEWDSVTPTYMRQALFTLLSNAPGKRYVELGEGTHMIMLEKDRLQLFKMVQSFLDDAQ
jgi:pimeloyl-ACP methyl ester carboxylesterase